MMSTKETPVRRISQRRLAMYERYVEKLRLEDFEKLTQFCKLHLSFLMDMDSERFEELFVEKQSSKSKLGNLLSKRKSLGSAGDRSSMCDKTLTGQPEIDQSVSRLASFLNGSQNLCQEGIFRKTGNIGRQKELKERLQLNEPVDLGDGYYTAHDCASVLKSFVGDLSEPLLHEKLFNAHLHTLEINKEETRLKVVCLLLQMMSSSHYKLAKLIFTLLHKVTVFCPQNLMNADNLGAIFAPHMLCPKKLSSSDLQNMAGQMQSVISFIIYHTPQLFVVPELLALDAVNHTKKTNINMSSSEESILSLESLDSTDHSRLTRKHKLRRSSEDESEPIDTVVTFAQRRPNHSGTTVTQDTEVELAKLYAHVQSMPDSSKKRKLMKQFSEANGYQSQVVSRKKHTRSRSFGESIKRRFSRRGRQKLLNVSTDQSNGADNSVVIENGGVVPVACVSLSTENQHNKPIIHRRRSLSPDLTVNITTLPGSPYPLHRTSMKHLREKPDGAESRTPPSVPSDRHSSRADIDRGNDRPSPEGGEQCDDNLDEAFHQPSTVAPVIRKPLMPTANLPQTPDNKHMTVKKIREHRNTPPGPKRAMAVFDSSIRV